jgi:16S rRNA (cytosine1402-N4)-methyltransferase
MAIRIYINHELENLTSALKQTIDCLDRGGRLAVISYHSLEDRIVKQFILTESKGCICPPSIPVCRCGHQASLKIINRKVITPSEEEIKFNPRSRSAKLRVAERL